MPLKQPIRRALIVCAALTVSMCLRGDSPSSNPSLPDSQSVIGFLNQSIAWQRGIASLGQIAGDPAEVLYFNESRQTGKQALQLSFQFAREYAQYLAQFNPQPNPEAQAKTTASTLTQTAAAAENEAKERQADLEKLAAKLSSTHGGAREKMQAQIDALQSEVELEHLRGQTLRSLLAFTGGSGNSGSLQAQIAALEQSVPELQAGNSTNSASSASAGNTAETQRTQPATGLVGIAENLIQLGRQSRLLRDEQKSTDDLVRAGTAIRTPLVKVLTSIINEGDKEVEQSDTTVDYTQQKKQLDNLTKQYKELADAVLPLGEQRILLNGYQANLDRWREVVSGQYDSEMRALALRLAVLAFVLIAVLTVSEVWRKSIVKYVHDFRRRYQLLLIRRFVIWITIALAIAFALASQIGSLATYIGLVTAGMAVALQNVILAIAGYFFLIGKYGVRVGDRVQIAGVSGIVIDIGLIRLHMMEVGSAETGREPTGRVVVFSNAIVFQSGASFFKQIPGTNYTWHEVTLTLAPGTNYQAAEKNLLAAVESVYDRYRDRIERQHRAMQENLTVAVAVPRPYTRLKMTKDGMEVIIRFPTEMENSAEMDDAVTRALLKALEESPRMKLADSAPPVIQPASEQPATPPESKKSA